MGFSENVNLVLSFLGGGLFTLLSTYLLFRVKLEARLKDLEHEVEFLKPFKDILKSKGLERVKKVYEEREEEKKQ